MESSPSSPSQPVTRVERTFAFVDISGFTSFTDRCGDAAAVVALSEFRLVVRDVASHHGVRIDKWLGDGAMFVSVHVQPLVNAVYEIGARLEDREFPLPLRAGITCGHVILFEGDDYIGTPVNLAHRLCMDAQPGQLLATEAVAAEAPAHLRARPMGQIEIRGLAQPVPVVSLEPVTADPVPAPETLSRR
jgi:class 3 adenylate cyclase